MLLPRPEIRIPTRLGSRIVGRGPVLRRIPSACLAADGAAARPLLDFADPCDLFAFAVERLLDRFALASADDNHHADPAIEGAGYFSRSNVAALLKKTKNVGRVPSSCIYNGMATFRQNPRNILEKPAARNVCET